MNTLIRTARQRSRPGPPVGSVVIALFLLVALAWAPPSLQARDDRTGPAGGAGATPGVVAERMSSQDPASATDENPVTELDERAAGRQERQSTGPVVPHPEAQEAIGRLKSPFCPGLMLEVCPSPQAAAVRDTLQRMAEEGADADSLEAWFLASYGEEWRGVPETRGRGLLAWVVPPAMLLVGAVLVIVALRRLRGDDEEDAPAEAASLTAEDERRIDEALRELERGGR